MKVKHFFIVAVLLFFSCSLESYFEPQIQIIQNDETFDKLFFFDVDTEPYGTVTGIDPETFEVKVRIVSSTRELEPLCQASDGRLFVVAYRPRSEDEIVVFNKEGKIINKIKNGFRETATMFVVSNYLIISGAWTMANGKFPVGMIDINSYKTIFYEGLLRDWIFYSPYSIWKNYLFLKPMMGNQILRINLSNPEEREIKTNYLPDNMDYYHYWIYDNKLLFIDRLSKSATEYSGKVWIYNLNNDELITNFFVTNYVSIPPEIECYYALPVVIGSELLIYCEEDTTFNDSYKYARMLVFDKDNYSFKYEVNLDNEMWLPTLRLNFIRGTKLYYETSDGIYIYDHSQKKCVKHITEEEVGKR